MSLPKTIKINACRLCKNKKMIKIFSYGNVFVSNFVEKKNIKKGIKAPLDLIYCKKCKLLQLNHSAYLVTIFQFWLHSIHFPSLRFMDIYQVQTSRFRKLPACMLQTSLDQLQHFSILCSLLTYSTLYRLSQRCHRTHGTKILSDYLL